MPALRLLFFKKGVLILKILNRFKVIFLSVFLVFSFSVPCFSQTEQWLEDYNFPKFPTKLYYREISINDWFVYLDGGSYYAVAQTDNPSGNPRSYVENGNVIFACYTNVYRWTPSSDSSWVPIRDVYSYDERMGIACSVDKLIYSGFNLVDKNSGEVSFFATPSPTSIMTSMYGSDLVQTLQMALKLGLIIVVSWLVFQAGFKVFLRVLQNFRLR